MTMMVQNPKQNPQYYSNTTTTTTTIRDVSDTPLP